MNGSSWMSACFHPIRRDSARFRWTQCSQYTAVIGAEHRTTLAASLNLANAYQSIGRLTDAVRLLRDTVERCERSLPDSDSLAIAAREGLAAMTGSV